MENIRRKKFRTYYCTFFAKIIFAVLFTIIGWHPFQAAAQEATSQDVDITTVDISVNFDERPLDEVLKEIGTKAGVRFNYNGELFSQEETVTYSTSDTPVSDILKAILPGSVRYSITGNNVFIQQVRSSGTIQGTVTEAQTGEQLPGATVILSSTVLQQERGTTTDSNGAFSFKGLAEGTYTLKVSFIGFKVATIPDIQVQGEDKQFDVELAPSTEQMDEVVVVGFGKQKKVNLTGSVEMVTSEDLQNRPTTSTANLIQGVMPGVDVRNYTGMPGQGSGAIRIRGVGTLNNSNPLVIIDGVEGDMNLINPEDIETVSVLKDAASAAVYGSRAANGVILITTKSGQKNQQPEVSFNTYYGFQRPTRLPERVGADEYMRMQNEAQRNVGRPATFTEEEIQRVIDGSDPNYYADTDWIEAIFREQAPQQNHTVSVSGGEENLGYYLSYGYLDQEGILTGNSFGYSKHNARLKVNTTIFDIVDINANLGYIDREYFSPQWATNSTSGVIAGALSISPLVPVRFTNGEWGYGGGANNPVAVGTDGGSNRFRSEEYSSTITGGVDILESLRVEVKYGLVKSNSKRQRFVKKVTYTHPEDGSYWYSNTSDNQLENRDYISNYQSFSARFDYNQDFGQHNLKLLGSYSQEWERYDSFAASRRQFVTEEVPVLNIGAGEQRNSGDAYHWAIRSLIGRLNYSYRNTYLLEANMRYDGSSRFAKDNRYGLFPSASVGWRFTEEPFLEGIKSFMTEGKIRASWGRLGNQYGTNLTAYSEYYPYVPVLTSTSTMPIGDELTYAFAQQGLANSGLSWETSEMTNIGIDLAFLDDRLSLSGDWYTKRTKDILLTVPLPDVIGLSEPVQNAGTVENKGWEVKLGWQDHVNDFSYGLDFQLADVRNQVVSLGDAPPTYGTQVRIPGHPIDAYYGLVADRIAQPDDFEYDEATDTYTPKFPVLESDRGVIAPGDLVYKDLNHDGEVTMEDDRKVIGNPNPRYSFALRGNMAWRGIDFSFFLQGVGKVDGYVYGRARHAFTNESAYPQKVHRDRWTPENMDASYPRFTYQRTHNIRVSSFWLEDASYMRLKNVQLGYTLPSRWTEGLRINNMRLYMSADNLFTLTDYFYAYDPETPLTRGGYYPQVKTLIVGVNLRFK